MIPIGDDSPHRRRFPLVTWTLVVVNALVFIYAWQLGEQRFINFTYAFGTVPCEVTGTCPAMVERERVVRDAFGRERIIRVQVPYVETERPIPAVLTLLTAIFLHGGWLHLLGNLLYLHIFGDNVEDRLGRLKYAMVYLTSGVLASAAQLAAMPGATIPAVGASGAVAGVMGAYLYLFPGTRIRTLVFLGFFITVIWLPALLVIGLWFVIQLFQGLASLGVETLGQQGGVAYFAHLGGFLAGIIWMWLLRPRRGYRSWDSFARR